MLVQIFLDGCPRSCEPHGFLSSICAKRNIANDCLPIVYANFLNKRRKKKEGSKRSKTRKKNEKTLRNIPRPFFQMINETKHCLTAIYIFYDNFIDEKTGWTPNDRGSTPRSTRSTMIRMKQYSVFSECEFYCNLPWLKRKEKMRLHDTY